MQARRRTFVPALAGLLVASILIGFPVSARPAVAAAPFGVIPMEAGAAEIVADGTGRAYVANPWRNRVDVVSLATGTSEAPIAVGNEPRSLDLSLDGSKLYVANAASGDVSVVDLTQEREVRRLAIPAPLGPGKPSTIAVAANGIALVGRSSDGHYAPTLLRLDLVTEQFSDAGDFTYTGNHAYRVRATADRSAVGILSGSHLGATVRWYRVGTNQLGPWAPLRWGGSLAVDGSGDRLAVGGADTVVLDRDVVRRATIPGEAVEALAVNRAGTTLYRLQRTHVEVVNLVRGLVVATISLPDSSSLMGAFALSRDEATLVVGTMSGLSLVGVAAASPRACPAPSAPAGVLAICGAPLADVVIDGRGRAYASNRSRNQVEVVSLAGRVLEAPIPVGSQPTDLDLSPDGAFLYVLNAGAEDISVVDLTLRREIRRITVVQPGWPGRHLVALAVAANATGLVITRPVGEDRTDRLLQIDLAATAPTGRERGELGTFVPVAIEASGDHRRIVVTDWWAEVRVYSSAADEFSAPTSVGGTLTDIAVDRSGDVILFGPGASGFERGTSFFDGELVRRGTIDGYGAPSVVTAAGTTAYRAQAYGVEGIDLGRQLVTRYAQLPEPNRGHAPVALSPDDATLAVLTPSGLSVIPTASLMPWDVCGPVPVAPTVLAVCGAPLHDVVTTSTGYAFASNPSRNQIEVVSLVTGRLEAPIPVGSRPAGLDLSADEKTLYIADSGAEEISVVDVAARREVERITVRSTGANDRPNSLAVAANGTAIVTTTFDGWGAGARVVQLDLATGTAQRRTDFSTGSTTNHSVVRASGDRERVAVLGGSTRGPLSFYDAATDRFGPALEDIAEPYAWFVAVDGSGDRALLGPNGQVVDGSLTELGQFPTGGKGVAINRAGTRGYRVQENAVEELNLDTLSVVRSLALPDSTKNVRGSVALSPDGGNLVVLTQRGIAVVPVHEATQAMPFTIWSQPAATPLDGLGTWVVVGREPIATAGQRSPAYLYSQYASFLSNRATAAVGLAVDAGGKSALFSVSDPAGGPPRAASVRFDWKAGRLYYLFLHQLAPGRWGAWVYDYSHATWVGVGVLELPAAWGKLASWAVTATQWYGIPASACTGYPKADVYFLAPIGYAGGSTTTAALTLASQSTATCAAQVSQEGGWSRSRVGA